ncbi:MAG: glycosyltransferase family 39 protein, partial [Thermodesulfobacteriota bacterium]
MISLLAAYLIPWLIGSALTGFLFPVCTSASVLLLRSALALGVGFGMTSSVLFLWLLGVGEVTAGFFLLESMLGFLSLLALLFQKHRLPADPPSWSPPVSNRTMEKKFRVGFFLFLLSGSAIMVLVSLLSPHGDWDAWAIWNNRARFLFRSGPDWKASFSPLLNWSHPDYPLLLPLSIARIWFYLGRESLWVPAVTAMLFSVSVTVLLVSSLSLLRNKTQGYWGGIILLITPSFLTHGVSQFADLPLAFFFLAVLVVLHCSENLQSCRSRLLILSGLLAGFSAWTKNEGLLFVVVFLLIRSLTLFSRTKGKESWKSMIFTLAGLLPVLALVFAFKFYLAPPNDLLSLLRTDRVLTHLTDPGRYFLVLKYFFT